MRQCLVGKLNMVNMHLRPKTIRYFVRDPLSEHGGAGVSIEHAVLVSDKRRGARGMPYHITAISSPVVQGY